MNISLISKTKDEENILSQFQSLEKAGVLQEVRKFNKSPLAPRSCLNVLSKLTYLLNHGNSVSNQEATDAFFAATKLFQSQDNSLRRMIYVAIRELAPTADDVIIVTSSLSKDLTGKVDTLRAGALRALCAVIDPSMLQSVERYLKQAIVDRNPSVSSAALVSSHHMMATSTEVIKRWTNEIQETTSHDNPMVQYHGTGLLYKIRKHDRLGVTKMVSKLIKNIKSPHACCLLIRIISRSEMVIYEAACAIIRMKYDQGARELQPAISVLSVFLTSPKAVLKYAAAKTLSKVAMEHPTAVTICNIDLENLSQDSNRSIATLAITTLLKTGTEASVERLMKQIAKFMGEIPDEFKVVVMQSVQSLCAKFPKKHQLVMSHLSSWLREEGGYDYKKAIVSTLVSIVNTNLEAKENALGHLCEFIEDCEHSDLACEVLYMLGKEGPRASQPRKYIQYVYNRVILETAQVRAAAISVLATFGAMCEELLPSITVLLERCLLDDDDLVRDRASMYLTLLDGYQIEDMDAIINTKSIITDIPQVSIFALEQSLLSYTSQPQMEPFRLKSVPLQSQESETFLASEITGEKELIEPVITKGPEATLSKQEQLFVQISGVPELSGLGPVFKSNILPIELTESETEYVVKCTKHMFTELLENIYVQIEPQVPNFQFKCYVPCEALPYNKPGTSYACFKLPDDPTVSINCSFTNTLKFTIRDCDPNTGEADEAGYEDEYVLEDLSIDLSDHIQGLIKPNFSANWDDIGDENQIEETLVLSNSPTVEEAVTQLITFLSMTPCDKTNNIDKTKASHTLLLSGVFRGGHDVLLRAKLIQTQGGVTTHMVVRSKDMATCDIVAQSILS